MSSPRRISRRTMDVHAAVALGSVIAGAALFGAIGALIGIPVAAVALAIIDTFSKRHELVDSPTSRRPATTTRTRREGDEKAGDGQARAERG